MSSELLLEVRTDPMPPAEVEAGIQRLKNTLVAQLRAAGVAPKQSATGFTARRLLVLLRGISGRDGEGLGANAAAKIGEVVADAIENLTWPTSMVWQDQHAWLSPVRGVLLLLDGERVPATVFGVSSSAHTLGPESSGLQRIPVADADQYGRALAEVGIEVRFPERRRRLQEQLVAEAQRFGGELVQDAALLKERAVACETASVVSVPIDSQFSSLPRELLLECARDRLGGFCILGKDGEVIAASFVMDRWDDPDDAVARSYEWALTSYLDDLRFYLERDRRLPLAERCREQQTQTLSAARGTHGERAARCDRLCEMLCDELGWSSERDRAKEAISLLAADGRTELLRAFPGLEGVIGGLLAREEGYATSVWQALADSRRPALEAKSLPRGRVGKLVALADRVDRLASNFSDAESQVGNVLVPGDRDSARVSDLVDQLVRIGLGGGMALDLRLLVASALRQSFKGREADRSEEAPLSDGLAAGLAILDHAVDSSLVRVFQELGFQSIEIAAVLSADGSSLLSDQLQRLEGLRTLRGDQRLDSLAQTAKRIAGILQGSTEQALDVALLTDGTERDLYFVYRRLVDQIVTAREEGSFTVWLQHMTGLNTQIDQFLRDVLVRDENERLRLNRLALLQRIHWLYAGEIRVAELLEDDD